MTSRLTLISAASTEALYRGAFPDDEPINAKGAAKTVAAKDNLRFADRSLTSPALRARQTAEALGLMPMIDPMLRECGYGRWSGRELADIHVEEPDGVAAWITDPAAAPHGGESITDVVARAGAWLQMRLDDSGHMIAITHPGLIRAAIVYVLDTPPQSFWRIDIEPLSKTDLRGNNGRWTLRASGCDLA